jgi:hypothetical protein
MAICKALHSLERIGGKKVKILHILRCYSRYFWRMNIEEGVSSSDYKELLGHLIDCEERMAQRVEKCIRRCISYLRNAIFDRVANRQTNILKKMKLKARMMQNMHIILSKQQKRSFR